METQVYKLMSGVEVEATLITGKHHKIFSKQGEKDNKTKMLTALIKRIGKKTDISEKDIKKMPLSDVTDLLIKLRLDSIGNEISFVLEWKGEKEKIFKKEHTLEISEETFARKEPTEQFSSYDEMPEEYEVELPRCKKTVLVNRMTQGIADKKGKSIKMNDIHLNTLLEWQNPRFVGIDTETQKPRLDKCDIDDLVAMDIEHLRKQIYLKEGRIDTSYTFENPLEGFSYDKQQIDIVNSLSFLFPSL